MSPAKNLLYAVAIVLTMVSTICHAERWKEVTADSDNNMWSVELDSIRHEDALVRAWIRVDHATPEWDADYNQYLSRSLYSYAVDCQASRYALTAVSIFGGDGERIDSGSFDRADWLFDEAIPGTVASSTFEFACAAAGERFGPANHESLALLESTDWIELSSDDEAIAYVHKSYDTLENGAQVLVKYSFREPQAVDGLTVTDVIHITQIDCPSQSTVDLQVGMLNLGGMVVSEYVPEDGLKKAEEGTHAAILHEFYCSGELAAYSQQEQPATAATRATGTGWLVDHGYIVTAQHVIDGATSIAVVGLDGEPIPARVQVVDQANDLALLVPEKLPLAALGLPMSKSSAGLGGRVFTIGFPHPDLLGSSPKMAAGEVSGTMGLRDDPRHLQISVPLQSGNSGGPLVNSTGQVVGVVTSKLDASAVEEATGDLPQNVNYAIKGRYLSFLLLDLPRRDVPALATQPDWSIEDLTREVKRAVVLVIAE